MALMTTNLKEVSATGDFETQIQRLLRELRTAETGSKSPSKSFIADLQKKPTDYAYANILVDDGNGRITSGLRSLELLSLICSGTSPQNLFLFDSVIYTGSENDFKTANDKKLLQLVLQNLGMETVVSSLSDETTIDYKSFCLRIGNQVKTGTFVAATVDSFMLTESKRLVKLFLKKEG